MDLLAQCIFVTVLATARIPMDLLSLSFTLCFGMRRGRGARNHRLSTGSHGIRTVSYPYPKLRIPVAPGLIGRRT